MTGFFGTGIGKRWNENVIEDKIYQHRPVRMTAWGEHCGEGCRGSADQWIDARHDSGTEVADMI